MRYQMKKIRGKHFSKQCTVNNVKYTLFVLLRVYSLYLGVSHPYI